MTNDFQTIEEARKRCNELYDIFLKVRTEYPEAKLSLSDVDTSAKRVFFHGNKTVGDDYELNAWKDVPIFSTEIHSYASHHPTKPNQFWILFKIGFCGIGSSEMAAFSDERITELFHEAFKNAINDFIQKDI